MLFGSDIMKIAVLKYTILCLTVFALSINGVYAGKTDDYVHYRLGVKYKNEKKLEQAVEEFRRVLAAYPDNYNTYMHIAEIREFQKRHRLSIFNLKKALAYNPGWSKARKMLVTVYEKDGQYQNAIKELQDYAQVCDPQERVNVQKQIDNLIDMVKYGGRKKTPVKTKTKKTDKSIKETTGSVKVKQAKKPGRKKIGKISSQKQPIKNSVAEREFKLGVKKYSDGVATQNQKTLDEAVTHFRNALKLHPGHAGAYYYAGLIRRRNGQNEMAKFNFEKSLSYPELGYNAHFYLGKIYGEEKKYKKAIGHLKIYRDQTDYRPGKREAQSLIERYTSTYNAIHKDTLKIDLKALKKNEMHHEIKKIPDRASYAPIEIRIDSLLFMAIVDTLTDPGQAMLAGVRAFNENRYDDAIEDFKKVLLLYPKGNVAARSIYDIGVCYLKLKNYSAAENKFQQFLDQYRSHALAPQSLFLKALTFSERHEASRSEKLYRKFIQANRGNKWIGKAYEKLGDSYVELMRNKQAVDAYSQSVQNSKSSLDRVYALYKLGKTYQSLNNASRATKSFQKAISYGEKYGIYERVPDSYYKIADHYYKIKEYSKSLNFYRKATRKYLKYQDTPWGLFQIGSIYKNLKKYDKAINAFNSLIKSYPEDYWARQAKWKLEDTVWEHEYRAVLK